jgi:Raf kinase inhibitor-like YbhB/YbcL family protein
MRAAYALIGIGIIIVILMASLGSRSAPKLMFTISSQAFSENGPIPEKYTCDANLAVNPPLSVSGAPEGTKSLVLIMDDPDIPQSVKESMHINVFDHWIVFNIPPDTMAIPEGSVPPGIEGVNGAGVAGYAGPCPPDREHRYFFKLYALDAMLPLTEGASRAEIEEAMQGHVLQAAELIGRYNRTQNR